MNRRISFIGAGIVGKTIAKQLSISGHKMLGFYSKTESSVREAINIVGGCKAFCSLGELAEASDVIFITTPDRVIGDIACELAKYNLRPGTVILHCSGCLSSNVLSPLANRGAFVGSMHPMQTFPSVEKAVSRLPGTYWFYEGSKESELVIEQLVHALKGKPVKIPVADKPFYHIACVFASNYLVALYDVAINLMREVDVADDISTSALYNIMETTLLNVKSLSPTKAVTGPVVRGDIVTIQRHIDVLKESLPNIIPLYTLLGSWLLNIGSTKGTLSDNEKKSLADIFNKALENLNIK
jgi:predicted short-subunit dehydrogenase-like oxidoreductase (DUF2520 family)